MKRYTGERRLARPGHKYKRLGKNHFSTTRIGTLLHFRILELGITNRRLSTKDEKKQITLACPNCTEKFEIFDVKPRTQTTYRIVGKVSSLISLLLALLLERLIQVYSYVRFLQRLCYTQSKIYVFFGRALDVDFKFPVVFLSTNLKKKKHILEHVLGSHRTIYWNGGFGFFYR